MKEPPLPPFDEIGVSPQEYRDAVEWGIAGGWVLRTPPGYHEKWAKAERVEKQHASNFKRR